MTIQVQSFANVQQMEVVVNGPGNANRLFIISGTAVFNFTPLGDESQAVDDLIFAIGPFFQPGQLINLTAGASLASISNQGTAIGALWAVDSVNAGLNEAGRVQVIARLVVRDTDGFINRLGFQVHILAAL
ncbi:MAG: hypothetical protein ACRDZO_23160 [Egibacteraceae bacterium]